MMKKNIERTLFWFKDGEESILHLCDRFFALSNLFNRLMNEKYLGKKLKFVNLYFTSEETYKLYPKSPKHYTNYVSASGHLWYNDVFDFVAFDKLDENEQENFIWQRAYEVFQIMAKATNNSALLEASEYAYKKGVEINLNADYKVLDVELILHQKPIKAAMWINFKKEGMYAKLTLEKEGIVFFEKAIDNTVNGIGSFLEIYKKIEVKENTIIIKGHYSVDYLPLKIPIDVSMIP